MDHDTSEAGAVHWHIVGCGAMGCLWGAQLAAGSERVTLLARGEAELSTLDRQGGITVARDGKSSRFSVAAELASRGPPIGHLLVCVKAHQTLAALAAVAHRVSSGSRLVFMQNGMGQLDEVTARYPDLLLYPAVTTEGAWRRGPFSVVHAGRGLTWLGPHRPGKAMSPSARFVSSLRGSGLNVHWDPDIETRQWLKLAVNCAVNPLTALLGCENGHLLKPEAAAILARLCAEIESVLGARGLVLEQSVESLAREVLAATAANRSSMLQDVEAGRETEIDYLNGFLSREAKAKGIALSLNDRLLELVTIRQAVPAGGTQRRPRA